MDLTERRANGEHIDWDDITKHKKDVFRLSALLVPGTKISVNQAVWNDLHAFLAAMQTEYVDTKQMKIPRKKEEILAAIAEQYTQQ